MPRSFRYSPCPFQLMPVPVHARSRYQSRAADHEAHTASKWRCARHWLKRRCNRTAVECLSAACVCILGLSAVRFATAIKAMKPNTVAFNAAESKHSHDRFRVEPNLPLLRGSSLHYAHPVELGCANPACNPSCSRAERGEPSPGADVGGVSPPVAASDIGDRCPRQVGREGADRRVEVFDDGPGLQQQSRRRRCGGGRSPGADVAGWTR